MKFSHLNTLNSEILLTQLHDAVIRERESTTAVLYHIQEIERRKLHLEKGYDSLHTFLVEVERYSKGAAHRRIKAMQLLKTMPEVEEKLESGALNLTTATIAQSYFEKKKVISQDAKREVLGKIEGKSKEEAERLIVTLAPDLAPPMKERVKPISETLDQVTFAMDQELREMFDRIKALSPYQGNYLELFKFMARKTLERIDPEMKKRKAQADSDEKETSKVSSESKLQANTSEIADSDSDPQSSSPENPRTRYIAASVERAVWQRDESQCAYIDEETGQRCTSRIALQLDHYPIPFALGGPSSPENLRLACPAHNRHTSWKPFRRENWATAGSAFRERG